MPIPPGFLSKHPPDTIEDDGERGRIYRDPSAPDGIAAYYVILSHSPKRVLRVEVPAEDVDAEVRAIVEGARDALMQRRIKRERPELRLIG